MCRAVVLIIKPIVFSESRRCGRRRSSSLIMVVVVVVMMQPRAHFFREKPWGRGWQGGTRNITVIGYTLRELIGGKKAPNV